MCSQWKSQLPGFPFSKSHKLSKSLTSISTMHKGLACFWLMGIHFSERLHADSSVTFISYNYVPKEPGSVWGLCQELKQKHSHTHTHTALQTYISLSFVFWNQVKCLFVYFLISISKWLQHTACFGKLCQCVLKAFFNDNITNNNQWKPHGCWTACEMLKVHMFCVTAQMPAVGSRVCKRAHMWAIVSARGWLTKCS